MAHWQVTELRLGFLLHDKGKLRRIVFKACKQVQWLTDPRYPRKTLTIGASQTPIALGDTVPPIRRTLKAANTHDAAIIKYPTIPMYIPVL